MNQHRRLAGRTARTLRRRAPAAQARWSPPTRRRRRPQRGNDDLDMIFSIRFAIGTNGAAPLPFPPFGIGKARRPGCPCRLALRPNHGAARTKRCSSRSDARPLSCPEHRRPADRHAGAGGDVAGAGEDAAAVRFRDHRRAGRSAWCGGCSPTCCPNISRSASRSACCWASCSPFASWRCPRNWMRCAASGSAMAGCCAFPTCSRSACCWSTSRSSAGSIPMPATATKACGSS